MKRIGILTFHGSHNYGSVLQAYALSSQLKGMGYDAAIINLRNRAQKAAYRAFQVKGSGAKKLLHGAYALCTLPAALRRYRNFEGFIQNVLPITGEEYSTGADIRESFDIYVCGSDQVWNPACQDFEPAYYLDFAPKAARRIAYAPSLGKAEFSREHLDLIRSLLPNMDAVSCREADGAELLRQLTQKPVEEVCDPVVLYGKENWERFARQPQLREPYILTYFLENNHGSKRYLQELRRRTGYRVVCLNEDIRDIGKGYTHILDATPQEFVGLFQHAALVYTNSFHGTAFATIFNRPLLTIVGAQNEANNNDSRKINYLQKLGLESRIVFDSLPEDVLALDYTAANEKMEQLRRHAMQYLKNALEG